jgi:transcriptional regulator with XRE-family HTH domain
VTLGEKLKSIRKMNKLNQNDFSLMIGVSQGTLSELEKNKYRPSFETIINIKTKFDVNLDWLLLDDISNFKSEVFRAQIDENEFNLITNFRELKEGDKQEINEIIKLKLKRYREKWD